MKINSKKLLISIGIALILLTTISFVSANENNTDISTYNEEFDKTNIPINEESLEDKGNIKLQNDETHNDLLKASNTSEKLNYYKLSSEIKPLYKTGDITIDPSSSSLPKIEVYVESYFYETIYRGNVEFEVDGKIYSRTISTSGTAVLSGDYVFNKLGPRTVKVTFLGNSDYYSSSTTLKYNVYAKTKININDITVNNGKSVTITPTVSPGFYSNYKAGNAILNIRGVEYTLNSTKESLTLNLNPGTYYCSAKYGTKPYYIESSDTFKITIVDEPLIVSQDYYITVLGEEYGLDIYVFNSKGNAINGGDVYLNDMKQRVYNGVAHFTLNPTDIAFDYYDVKYVPDVSYYKTVRVDKAFPVATISQTKLTINNLNTIPGTKLKNVKYTITDNLGHKINPSGYFLINGKKYNSLYDFKTPKKAGTFTYNIKFVPDLILYGNSTAKLKIVNKFKTKVKVKNIRGYENKKVKITATVKDNLGKNVKKGVVIFKIRGKSYKATVKNGKATKTIKIPKPGSRSIYYYYSYKNGKEIQKLVYQDEVYKCKVTFKDNSKYLKSSSTFKITSKKKSTYNKYYSSYTPSSKSSSGSSKKTTTKKTTTKKTSTKSYGYYPTYHKPQPCIDVDLFKKKPTVNPYTNLNNIIITT